MVAPPKPTVAEMIEAIDRCIPWATDVGGAPFRRLTAEELQTIRDHLASPAPSGRPVPEGWQLVPREPTFEMADAGDAQFRKYNGMIGTYKAVLAAAPQPPILKPSMKP